jgi:hypothetical protein
VSCHFIPRDSVGVRRWRYRRPHQPPVNPFTGASQQALRERIEEIKRVKDARAMRRLARIARRLVAGVVIMGHFS